jgi:hypothetical protein
VPEGALQDFLRNLLGRLQAALSNLNAGARRALVLLLPRCSVLDVVFVMLSILFFVVSIGYVVICDRLMK